MKPPVALTIAGSDPSGGAGLQADLKTFHNHECFGTSVVSLLTAQNTRGVEAVEVMDPEWVLMQLEALLTDLPPAATKTGALGNAAVIRAVAASRARIPGPLVVDPVMISKAGSPLLGGDAVQVLKDELLPLADIVTPNVHEARALTGLPIETREELFEAAQALRSLGCKAVYLKGAALEGEKVHDVFCDENYNLVLEGNRIEGGGVHGSGCVLSAAICARLARGMSPLAAVMLARGHVRRAIAASPGLGGGISPTELQARADGLREPRLGAPSSWSKRSRRMLLIAAVMVALLVILSPWLTSSPQASLLWAVGGALSGLMIGMGMLSLRMDAATWRGALQPAEVQAKISESESSAR